MISKEMLDTFIDRYNKSNQSCSLAEYIANQSEHYDIIKQKIRSKQVLLHNLYKDYCEKKSEIDKEIYETKRQCDHPDIILQYNYEGNYEECQVCGAIL